MGDLPGFSASTQLNSCCSMLLGTPGTTAGCPHPCVCVCPHFLGTTPKASLPAPRPILEALPSTVAVCMSVTVVQNKFYLSLLYPELDLALCDLPPPPPAPRSTPDRAQWRLLEEETHPP
uniref:Uncharacterized protein n=1 Tax=Catagonus wagneri TaxID=51154 RepID=A0A8C3WJP1_9CETA